MSSIDLTVSKSYVPTWGIVEGVRELFQNALDQEAITKGNRMSWTYDKELERLTISNQTSLLTRDTLLFGNTTKADNGDTIGKFGEGYKLAMLVLTRAGKTVTIFNNKLNEKWTPRFKIARKLNNATLLCVDIVKLNMPWNKGTNDLEITIDGINEDEFKELKETNLHLAFYDYLDDYSNKYGTVLVGPDMKGKVFVSGLYVTTDESLHYGYNLKPAYITLNRDRNMVGSYDLANATSKVCNSLPDDLLVEAIEGDFPDTKYISHRLESDTTVKEQIVNKIIATHGNNVKAVTSQREADTLKVVAPDLRVVVLTDTMASIVNTSSRINTEPVKKDVEVSTDSLYNDLKDYIRDHHDYLYTSTVEDLLNLLKKEDERFASYKIKKDKEEEKHA